MKRYMQKAMSFLRDEEGASAVEYAILVGLIALGITAGATALGGGISTFFTSVNTKLQGYLGS